MPTFIAARRTHSARRRPLLLELRKPLRCLISCLLWLPCFQLPHLSYVGKPMAQVRPHGERQLRTTMFVRERRGSLWRKNSNSKAPVVASGGKKAAKILTSRINKAPTATELLNVLNEAVDFPDFNYFHISTAYHTLAMFHRNGLLQGLCESPVLPKLHTRTKTIMMSQQINPQASANVLWAMAVIVDTIPGTTQLLPALIKVFPEKAAGMDEQELANCLWASAQLKDVAPDVLKVVQALIAQTPSRAVDMKPQELSNSLWASAHLKDHI
ncbi:unnamed protein product [Durusdinium trenchii]|uniref:Uncharacterized protein n=1 Tax=Durusdinium trenchii TaxID=1381693 RepID=A0ABP0Q797_9DINO